MNEIASPGQVISAMVVLALFAASPALTLLCIVMWRRGKSLVPFAARTPPKFGLIDIVLTLLAYIGLSIGISYFMGPLLGIKSGATVADYSPDTFLTLVLVNSGAVALACIAMALIAAVRTGTSASDLGITFRHAASDIRLGTLAFLLMGGFVYALQAALFQWFPQQHPLLELIQNNPEPKYFLGAIISAAIAAPIFEEFFFRAVLQGWLEKHLLPRQTIATATPEDEAAIIDAELLSSEGVTPTGVTNPYVSPLSSTQEEVVTEAVGKSPVSWLAILISSALFAAAHIGQGPAPIPLFFLAVCLGYLYQRTHRLLPCIVMHGLLNSTSVAMLWLSTSV